jgi:hypothetical protein
MAHHRCGSFASRHFYRYFGNDSKRTLHFFASLSCYKQQHYITMNTNLALSKESLVALAIEAFEKGQKKSLHAAALALGAPINLTYKRYNGRMSRAEHAPNGQKLTNTEEIAIEQWILSLDRRGFSPNLKMVADMANLLLVQRIPPVVGNLAVVGKY